MMLLGVCLMHLMQLTFHFASSSSSSSITITKMPDGVSIRGGETLHQITATWDIFVTLDPPPHPSRLAQQVSALNTTFQAVSSLAKFGILVDLEPLQSRRDRLNTLLKVETAKPRLKRGLMDVGGTILHALFGVATSAQLQRFKAALMEVADHQQNMAHAHNNLATIVNQTIKYANRLSVRQHQLEVHVLQIDTAIAKLAQRTQTHSRQIYRLELLTDLDRYLDVLDLATTQYKDQLSLFYRQRAELEIGRLTRDLLSQAQLTDILQEAAAHHKVIPSIEWYYQFLTVTPLWQSTGQLLYKVEIPLISSRPYLLYQISCHPVPIANASHTVNVQLQKVYAIDTVSGNLFVPKKCLGNAPTVCITGPEYGPTMLKCARGLLTNRSELIRSCSLQFVKYDGTTIVNDIDINQYAITSLGETLVIRCPGLTESHLALPRGTHNVTCLQPCTITGHGWTISCIDRLYLTRRFVMPIVQVTKHFNFSTLLKTDKFQIALPQLQLADAPPTLTVDMGAILQPTHPRSSLLSAITPSPFATFNMVCIAAFWIVLGLTFIRWRRFKTKLHAKFNTAEAIPLTAITNDKPPTSTASFSIWPTLPPLSDCMRSSHTSSPIVTPTE